MKKTTLLAVLSTLATLFVMLYPERRIGGVNLYDWDLEAALFSLSMLLWMIARGGRFRTDPYFVFRSNVWAVDLASIRHNIVTSLVEFVLLAGLLQSIKLLLPHREANVGKFFFDSGIMLAAGIIVYVIAVFALRTQRGRRWFLKL